MIINARKYCRRVLNFFALAPLLCVTRLGSAQPVLALPKPPAIQAASAILVDAVSGQVLYARNPDAPRPPASTTKIMTATLLIENTRPEDWITAGPDAAETEGSSLYLKAGERITARDMLYALLMRSANDGCVAVADHVAGSVPRFVEMMNRKALEIGAAHTHFDNPNGLNDPRHYTTARDLSIMARYASRYPQFNEVTRTKFYSVLSRTIDKKDLVLRNHARFLWKFPGADGVKTGYTVPAGHCFVGGATINGWRLISVVLKSPNIVDETQRLMKYGFQNFEPHRLVEPGQVCGAAPVKEGAEATVPAVAETPVQYVTAKGETAPQAELRPKFNELAAPVAAGARVGTLEAVVDGKVVGSAPLVAQEAVAHAALSAVVVGHLSHAWYLFAAMLGMVVIRYGATFAKTARRGGSGLAARIGDPDRRG